MVSRVAQTWTVKRPTGVSGTTRVPGDKSISHRAVLMGTLAEGAMVVKGFLHAEDTLASIRFAHALGAELAYDARTAELTVAGSGLDGLKEPKDVIDCGNSGTTMRLGAGIAAGVPGLTILTGDASLRDRPMGRVIAPLRAMGIEVSARDDDSRAPLAIRGGAPHAAAHLLGIASAQVKSCALLAGLFAEGRTTVVEPGSSRDHTERLLTFLGASVDRPQPNAVAITGWPKLRARDMTVVGDFSSAAFLLAAAAVVPDGEITVEGVGLNATRTGLLDILKDAGASVSVDPGPDVAGEPAGSVKVEQSPLLGFEIGGDLIVRAIDELPVVAVLATQAAGETVVRDAGELRAKESDRISVMCERLRAMGADMDETEDGFVVRGPSRLKGCTLDAAGDHRVAMALAVAGLVADGETVIEGAQCADVSFPGFARLLGELAPGAVGVGAG